GYVDSDHPLRATDSVRTKHRRNRYRELITARPDQTVFEALGTMQAQDLSQLPVFENGEPIGTLSEDQVLELAVSGKDLRSLVIREVRGPPLPVVSEDAPVSQLTWLLRNTASAVFVRMADGRHELLTKHDLMANIAEVVATR